MQIQLTRRFYDKVLGFYQQRENARSMFYTYDHKAVVRLGFFPDKLIFEEVKYDLKEAHDSCGTIAAEPKKITVAVNDDLYFDTEEFKVIDKSFLPEEDLCADKTEINEADDILFKLVEELEGKTMNVCEGSDLVQIFERAKTYVAHKKFETMSLDEKIFTIARTAIEGDHVYYPPNHLLRSILQILDDANVFSIAHQIMNERSLASDDCCRNSLATEILEKIGEIRNESNS